MKSISENKVGSSAALMIFCLFAMSVLTVLMLGVSAYRNMTEISLEDYDEQVCLSYIWTKIKNGDEAGTVYVGDFGDRPALFIDALYGDATYHTIIYHYEGRVYELTFESGLEFFPGDGVPVIENESLSFERLEAGLIKVSAGYESVFISPRARGGIVFAGGPLI